MYLPSVGSGFALFLIIFCGVLIPVGFAIFCYFYCRRQNGDRVFIFKRPFNMYVASFVDRIRCGSCTGGGGGLGCNVFGGCAGMGRRNRNDASANDEDERSGKTRKLIKSNAVGDHNKSINNNNTTTSASDEILPANDKEPAKKVPRKIEIMPVELISCTNNELVSSSICLKLKK